MSSLGLARRLGTCVLTGRPRPANNVLSSCLRRHVSTISSSSTKPATRWRLAVAGGTLAGLALSTPFVLPRILAESGDDEDKIRPQQHSSSLGTLVRSYVVYSMCEIPVLVDMAPALLSFVSSIPIVKNVAEAVIRVTFFDQFVGADTAQEAIPLLKEFRASNMGALFAYSVEVDESEAMAADNHHTHGDAHQQIVKETIHCIDVAADFDDDVVGPDNAKGRRTWVALKMTAMVPDANALISLSRHILMNQPRRKTPVPFPGCPQPSDLDVLYSSGPTPGLTESEKKSLRDFHQGLKSIGRRARERGVRLIIDAEYSWYQPAIDAFQLNLMQEFNKPSTEYGVQPLVYGTYQAYLRRTPQNLTQSFADAKAGGYSLGVKLVRGAYHPHEVHAHPSSHSPSNIPSPSTTPPTFQSLSISPEPEPPVWLSKAETDKCYNDCARFLIKELKEDVQRTSNSTAGLISSWWGRKDGTETKTTVRPGVGILFGTHNWESCQIILDELVNTGLASAVEERIHIPDEVNERLTFGQLYGMMDALTQHIANKTTSSAPTVIKYVPYGALAEVMPYLSRRAIENKSVLGGGAAKEERKAAGAEIRKRLFG